MADADDAPILPPYVVAERTHLRLPSRPHWIEAIVEFLRHKAILSGACQEPRAGKLMIALHEALSNAIIHGNLEVRSSLKEQGDDAFAQVLAERVADSAYNGRMVDVVVDAAADRCRWTITDEGPGFDAEAVMRRLQSDDPELLLASGRGILIMKSFLDEVRYEHGGRRLILGLRRQSGEEKRLEQRVAVQQPVRIAPIRDDGSVDWEAAYEGLSRNFSEHGVGLLQQRLADSDRVLIGFQAQDQMVYVAAEVRHCRSLAGDVVELGCRFQASPPSSVPQLSGLHAAMDQFIEERHVVHVPADDRRSHPRVAYTERIEIHMGAAAPMIGFARDLSKGGIAFIVQAPLPADVVIVLAAADRGAMKVRARVVRCNKVMEGFYDAGAQFVEIVAGQACPEETR